MKAKIKVAIVYDWINQWGGAERVISLLARIYPGAHLYTSIFDRWKGKWALKFFPHLNSSFLNYFPNSKRGYYFYFPFLPFAFEQFKFDQYDLVISVTSFPGKFIITSPETFHACYCLTPPRFLWERRSLPVRLKRFFPFLSEMRSEDAVASERPDYLLATCHNVAQRIKKTYRQSAEIVYPGIDLQKFIPAKAKKASDYFLVVSRLVEYKRIDLVIKAFNRLGWPLKIIGSGRMENKLRELAENNIEFLGHVNDRQLVTYYQQCQGVICPQEEDFGLVPIEAQACGKPVIAFNGGGHRETIIPGKTGELFSSQTIDSLLELLLRFKPKKYDFQRCRRNAEKFSQEQFMKKIQKKINAAWQNYQKSFLNISCLRGGLAK